MPRGRRTRRAPARRRGRAGRRFRRGREGPLLSQDYPSKPPCLTIGAASLRTEQVPRAGASRHDGGCCRLNSLPPDIGGGEGRHVIREPQARPCARSELCKMQEIGRVVDIQRDSRQMHYGWTDAARLGGGEMREETVLAKTQRYRV